MGLHRPSLYAIGLGNDVWTSDAFIEYAISPFVRFLYLTKLSDR